MKYEEVLYYEKRDSHETGFLAGQKSGREEGLKEGIKGVIIAYKTLNATYEQAKTALIKQFNLTEEKANEYLHLYWQ